MQIDQAVVTTERFGADGAWQRGSPLPLVPVANRPLLFHVLDRLEAAGLRSTVVVSSHQELHALRRAVTGGGWAMKVDVRPGRRRHVLSEAIRHVSVGAPVLVQSSNLLCEGLRGHLETFARGRTVAMSLVPDEIGGWRTRDGNGWLLGHEAVEMLRRSPGEDAEQALRRSFTVRDCHVDALLAHGANTASLLAANRRVLAAMRPDPGPVAPDCEIQGPVTVHPTAILERAVIRGPVLIGANARVTDAYVGPYTSIGAGAVIEGTEIEHAILMEGARVSYVGVRVEGSVVGRRAEVTRTFDMPSALRVAVGDGARVNLS